MKKNGIALFLVLALILMLAPFGFAAGENYDTLADWNIRIAVPDNTTAVLKGSEYYIYAQKEGSIPYVMLTTYRYSSVEKFLSDFTAFMQGKYADLEVTAEAAQKTIGNKSCYEVDYRYSVSGNEVKDRRIVLYVDGLVYLFASKEVEARGMTVGSMLEDIVADCVFLSQPAEEPPVPEDEPVLANAYLYCEKSGMPKYWLDFTGAMADVPVLHCYFRSGDPTFYEAWFFLDLQTADVVENEVTIHTVTDRYGVDRSNWFKQLTIRLDADEVTMTVLRDESTLAGGADDNLLTGTYSMRPVGAGLVYQYHQKDGMLKYWLDQTGEDLELHAMFRSGDPAFYEEVFYLDSETAEWEGDYMLRFHQVFNAAGYEVSDWFESITLTEVQGALLLNVKRDESTLAGGADDNILSDVYLFDPQTYLLPAEDGPFTAEELGEWAQIYYFRSSGFFPPEAEVIENSDGSFTIHLFEIVSLDGDTHTATSAWYTVDAFGVGTDDITGAEVRLFA